MQYRYEKREDNLFIHIYVEEKETEQQVLRAIVKAFASVEFPSREGRHFFGDYKTDEFADRCISLVPRHKHDTTVAFVDCGEGEHCGIHVSRIEKGHFVLLGYSYKPMQEMLDLILNKTKNILEQKNG